MKWNAGCLSRLKPLDNSLLRSGSHHSKLEEAMVESHKADDLLTL